MKTHLFIAAAAIMVSSCNQAELDKSSHDKDSLQSVVNERDISLNDFIASFNEVESNLDSIAVRQHIILSHTDKNSELKKDQKARINSEIQAINELMEQNRKKLADLNHKLKNSGNKNAELMKTIATINNQLAHKDQELSELNTKLLELNAQVATLNTSVDTLNKRNQAQSQTIDERTMALHTAYYVMGKSGELKDAKIIDRQGGLLGIGRTSKLNSDFDNSKFTRIDYTQTSSIAVNSDMKIITSHPTGTFMLEKDAKDKDIVKNIVITDPEKFWSTSKYLVIVKN